MNLQEYVVRTRCDSRVRRAKDRHTAVLASIRAGKHTAKQIAADIGEDERSISLLLRRMKRRGLVEYGWTARESDKDNIG
jgi:Mn-dependent DtxR family transcriptional regulator